MRLQAATPAVVIHPRCVKLIDGFEAGYVWDARSVQNSLYPNTRRPRKDGTYDHLANCAEYTWINFGPAYLSQESTAKQEQMVERKINRARLDQDPLDKRLGRGVWRNRTVGVMGSRGGW
jgi:hypothetical protein